jgi:putative transposase
VVDYIHLNPVRAAIVTAEHIAEFELSSLDRFATHRAPAWLVAAESLGQAGLSDSTSGWARYVEGLAVVASSPAGDPRMKRGEYSAGWAIGTLGWRRALAKEHAQMHLAPEWASDEVDAFRRERWQQALEAALAESGRTLVEAAREPKTAPWKLQLAHQLREVAAAPYRWIAQVLCMGAPSSARAAVCRFQQRSAG